MSKFTVGQEVQIGTAEYLPDQSPIPYPGRVICVDAVNPQNLTVLVLVKEHSESNDNELMRQFNSDGLCYGAMQAIGHRNRWQYPESNLYPIEDDAQNC